MANPPPSLEEALKGVPQRLLGQTVTDGHLTEMAAAIKEWAFLIPFLELSVEEVKGVTSRDPSAQAVSALRAWKRKHGTQATYGDLSEVLVKSQSWEAVEIIVKLLTSELPSGTPGMSMR